MRVLVASWVIVMPRYGFRLLVRMSRIQSSSISSTHSPLTHTSCIGPGQTNLDIPSSIASGSSLSSTGIIDGAIKTRLAVLESR